MLTRQEREALDAELRLLLDGYTIGTPVEPPIEPPIEPPVEPPPTVEEWRFAGHEMQTVVVAANSTLRYGHEQGSYIIKLFPQAGSVELSNGTFGSPPLPDPAPYKPKHGDLYVGSAAPPPPTVDPGPPPGSGPPWDGAPASVPQGKGNNYGGHAGMNAMNEQQVKALYVRCFNEAEKSALHSTFFGMASNGYSEDITKRMYGANKAQWINYWNHTNPAVKPVFYPDLGTFTYVSDRYDFTAATYRQHLQQFYKGSGYYVNKRAI